MDVFWMSYSDAYSDVFNSSVKAFKRTLQIVSEWTALLIVGRDEFAQLIAFSSSAGTDGLIKLIDRRTRSRPLIERAN